MDERIRLKQKHDLMFIDRAVARCKEREARTASAAWKASAKKWRKYWHWRAGYCAAAEKRVQELEDDLRASDWRAGRWEEMCGNEEKQVAELEEALKTAIDAIRLLDDYSMGFVCDEDRGIRWPIRDELVDNLCKALNK